MRIEGDLLIKTKTLDLRKIATFLLLNTILILSTNQVIAQKLIVFEDIPDREPSEHYTCRVKLVSEDDSAWRNAFVLQTTAKDNDDEAYYKILRGWSASWITFESDFKGANVIVEISKTDGTAITEAMVRPTADAAPAVISNGKAYISFSEPANVNVDINGQMEKNYTGFGYKGPPVHTISLFANPVFHQPDTKNSNVKLVQPGDDIRLLDRSEWDTLVFAPGTHVMIDTAFEIHSNEVLYIPGDAIFKGTIHPQNKWGKNASKNFKVYGSGTISTEDIYRHSSDDDNKLVKPFTYQAEGAHLEGFVVADPAFHTFNMGHSGGDKNNINIYKNLKILAWRKNSDGVNAFRYSEVSDCFFRVQDDAFYLGVDGVNQHDNVVWNDANGAVLFLQNIEDGSSCKFSDVTVIYQRAQWHWWDGGRIVSIRNAKPGGSFNNIHLKNILVEDPLPAFPPFYLKMTNMGKEDIDINNVVFENIRQEHDGVSTSNDTARGKPRNTMLGLDQERAWENILFKNCYFNGVWLSNFDDGNFRTEFVNENTVNFESKKTK